MIVDAWVRSASVTVLLISLIGAAAPSFAQTYPQRPGIIVNVSAGGGVDITARALALHFGSVFKQPFIVDNRTAQAQRHRTGRQSAGGRSHATCLQQRHRHQRSVSSRELRPSARLSAGHQYGIHPAYSGGHAIAAGQGGSGPGRTREGETGIREVWTSGVGGIIHPTPELLAMLSNTKMTSRALQGRERGLSCRG